MKRYEIEALRDLGIENLPAANRIREQAIKFGTGSERYYQMLFLAASFAQGYSTTTAIERQAARLIEQVTMFMLDNRYEGIETTIIEVANDLISLLGVTIHWLPKTDASYFPATTPIGTKEAADEGAASPPTRLQAPALERGQFLTTKQAALALNRADQTLRKWASKQNGPISPVNVNGRNCWRSDDILDIYLKKNV